MQKNNDEIFNSLELLEKYAHLTPNKAFQIVKLIVNKKPLKAKTAYLKGFGKIKKKSNDDVLLQSIKILAKIGYLETKKVIGLLQDIYQRKNEQKVIKEAILKVFENLSKYNLFVLQQIGYKTQSLILDEIETWNEKKLINNLEILAVITKELFTPTFEGQSMPDYKTFTLHSGSLTITDDLKNLRNRTFALLKKMYFLTDKVSEKIQILHVLREATQTPRSHLYGDDMEKMVLDDTNNIINFYLEIIPNADNEIILEIEEQKIWFVKVFKKDFLKKINELDEKIQSNSAYAMFRVFVGYEGTLDPDHDFNRDRETRSRKIEEFISSISENNFEEWREKILTVIKNYSIGKLGSYSYFEKFLFELGSKKPDLGILLIEKNEKEIAPFLISLLSGMWKSDKKEQTQMIIHEWIKEGKYLYLLAFIFVTVGEIDEKLLRKIINKAKELKDTQALNNILKSILSYYHKNNNLKEIFIEVVQELIKLKNTHWVENLWFREDSVVNDLTEKEIGVILKGLLLLPNIQYQAEEILKPIAEKYPEKVINFFHERVEIKSKKKRKFDNYYDGVPFNLSRLGEVFNHNEKKVVPLLLQWYKDGDKNSNWLFTWEASHLFEEIFPKFSPVLEDSLISLIKEGDKNSRNIVFSILDKYKGDKFLWGTTKALIKQYAGTKKYEDVLDRLFGCLSQMGVVSGEDGFVRGYQAKKQEIQDLKNDPDEAIKNFVYEYEDYLDERITYERKRTNEEIELMKRGLK